MAKPKANVKAARKRSKKRRPKASKKTLLNSFLYKILLLSIIVAGFYVAYLDYRVRTQFEGKRWELPAHVYASPVELFQGFPMSASQFETLLGDLHYTHRSNLNASGLYKRSGSTFSLRTRKFDFWDGIETAKTVHISFIHNQVAQIKDLTSGRALPLLRLDPVQVGSFYPSHKEDRVLVKIDDVPQTLIDGLLAIEDKDFYHHMGVSAKGILRALWVNVKAGSVVQGGSTLTQQLVKNFYLNAERSLWRKAKEAVMALILEIRYEKNDILEAYLNEVFLGQDGERSINGFGMASIFYFNQPLAELKPHQTALLVGLVKGPSYYNPRRHPTRALKRRNLVLNEMVKLGVLPDQQRNIARGYGLNISTFKQLKSSRFPAFLDLVKRQLGRDYNNEDLTSEGLNIFSTLDYEIQTKAEKIFSHQLSLLSKRSSASDDVLQGAMVITRRESGEIVAVIGDKNPQYNGFNRALDAIRPIGSLVKPAVYLTALMDPSRYTLATKIEDRSISLKQQNGELWAPQNYDKVEHGDVTLQSALVHSYNLATVRLGMALKVSNVKRTIEKLGVSRPIKPYPSLLLGAIPMSPIEVAQMYQTFAGDGFLTPLRSIQSVMSSDKEPLQRYPLAIRETVDSSAVYLVNTAMQAVMREGTGRSVYQFMSGEYNFAGKTGTTDELRDSWFAGYSGDYVAVVWLGRDDNKPANLTGSQGALRVWAAVMREITKQAVDLTPTDDIVFSWVDEQGLQANESCRDAVQYPFIKGSEPIAMSPCVSVFNRGIDGAGRWFDGLLND
ncbi:MAG: penicillin-binding protein 1B [Piscirickettsiaceae bacterium]|nr:MAG: penicillin-binding protein 1B [Piscirickettsiaceae bacterium]PCI66914.1 MAG: penicillin-binding protein 1B [Piscirickettsiaceae bacterium]